MAPTPINLRIENRVGALAEITRILGEAHVNVTGVQLGRGPDMHNLRLMVDKAQLAIATLAKAGFEARRSEVVSMRIENTPGAIAEATERLAAKGINIEAVFLTAKSARRMHLVLQVDDAAAARRALGAEEE